MEFPGVIKKTICAISMGFGFCPWNFQGMQNNFVGFPVVKLCFLRNFQG